MLPHHPTQVSSSDAKRTKKRGSYNCGRCGLPKKGHSCHAGGDPVVDPTNPTPPRAPQQLRRSLSFDDELSSAEEDDDIEAAVPSGLAEVLRRLPPAALLAAAQVCRGWRDCARRVWRAAEELRLRVPPRSQVGFVGSVLRRCTGLVRLSLRIERLESSNLVSVTLSVEKV